MVGKIDYINEKLDDDWTLDIIIGGKVAPIFCSTKTLYRMFKKASFNQDKQAFISSVSSRRNNIPKKSLNYQTPIGCFIEHAGKDIMSHLILQITDT